MCIGQDWPLEFMSQIAILPKAVLLLVVQNPPT